MFMGAAFQTIFPIQKEPPPLLLAEPPEDREDPEELLVCRLVRVTFR